MISTDLARWSPCAPIRECHRSLTKALAFVLGAALTACGGGGSAPTPSPGPGAAKTPTALVVSATEGYLTDGGGTRQFSAIAKYDDGSSSDVTAASAWSSSDMEVASISSAPPNVGLATAGLTGSTTITAKWQGFAASARLLVGAPLVNITFATAASAVAPEATLHLAAWGHYANNADREITKFVSWQALDPDIAVIAPGTGGDVLGVKPGSATIKASLDGISADVEVRVLAITELAHGIRSVPLHAASVDGAGRLDAVVSDPSSGPLFGIPPFLDAWHGDLAGWRPKVEPATGIDDRPGVPVVATGGDNPVTMLAWSGKDGLYVTRRVGGGIWEPTHVLASVRNDHSFYYVSHVSLTIDHRGDAMLAYVGDQGFRYRLYEADTNTWGEEQAIPDAAGIWQMKMVGNAAGQRVIVWEQNDLVPQTPIPGSQPDQWFLWASVYAPGTGWSAPTLIHSGPVLGHYEVSINPTGQVLVGGTAPYLAWVPDKPTVFASRYFPEGGWQPEEVLSVGPEVQPTGDGIGFTQASTALDDNGNGFLVFASSYDSSIWVRRFDAATGWNSANEKISAGAAGSVYKVWAFATGDGRMLAAWLTGGQTAGYRAWRANSGWQPEGRFQSLAHKGSVGANISFSNISFSFNREGKGIAVWGETYTTYLGDGITSGATDVFADTTLSF